MLTEIAQIITIASYGNEYLNHGEEILHNNHSSLRLCKKVVYKDCCLTSGEIIAMNTNEWFEWLLSNGCKKVRLYYIDSEPQMCFEGTKINENIDWIIETIFNGYSDYWTYKWYYNNGDWSVEYRRIACQQPIIDLQGDLNSLKMELFTTLKELESFCTNENMVEDAAFFRNTCSLLDNNTLYLPTFHEDLITAKNYGLLARQVLFTAVSSWCFSGMGSWSDNVIISESKNQLKNVLTKNLFEVICKAIVIAVNTF
jgi:hypothetical protein